MTGIKAVHDFAIKWCDKFRDQKINYIELVDHFMADDCATLGFEMDCGHAFQEKYGSAVYDVEALDKIIDGIDDIPLLGSAIYSQWRYFNHWAYTGAEILEPKNRAWFIVALSRLANLSGENPFVFQGELKKIRIISNNLCYGPCPEPDDEIEQHLTINAKGRVWFSSYAYGDGYNAYKKTKSRNFTLKEVVTSKIFRAISTYFSNGYDEAFSTDIGDWIMELTNSEGTIYRFRGALCSNFEFEKVDLSDLIRESLGMDNLYVFDGNNKPDKILRIRLDYHRVTKIAPKNIPECAAWDHVIWDYSESFVIDGPNETLEHISNDGSGRRVSRKYEIEEAIQSLLEEFEADTLFHHILGNPDDVIENPNETKDYTITIDYKKAPQLIVNGTFDKNGLPDDYSDFAKTVIDFIHCYGIGEIFDSDVYGRLKRRNSDYIFCSCEFEDGYKSYYYIADDDNIQVGDPVVVPVGGNNHHAVVKVVKKEYFSEETFPMPVDKVKHIVCKYNSDDNNQPSLTKRGVSYEQTVLNSCILR